MQQLCGGTSCELDRRAAAQIVPTREAFFSQLAPAGGSNVLVPEMAAFLAAFRPVLGAISAFLEAHGLDFDAKV